MWKVFKNNFFKLYMGAFLVAFFEIYIQVNFVEHNFLSVIAMFIYLIIISGWYWLVLKILRGEKKPFYVFKKAFKEFGWLIILGVIKVMIFIAVTIICVVALSFFIDSIELLIITSSVVASLIYAFFAFSELVYYDYKDLGPLNAIYESFVNTKQIYLKIAVAYIFKMVSFVLAIPLFIACSYDFSILFIGFIWNFLVYPIFTLWICRLYENIDIKEVQVNDSLIAVAKALDESIKNN